MVVKKTLLISMSAMLLVGIFWSSWYLITGSIPQITELKITNDWQIALPFTISRWWDIPYIGIWSAILVLVFSSKTIKEEKVSGYLKIILVKSLLFGLIFGPLFILWFDLLASLIISLAANLILVSIIGPIIPVTTRLTIGLIDILVTGLSFGLATSLILGPIAGISISLSASLGYGMAIGMINFKWPEKDTDFA